MRDLAGTKSPFARFALSSEGGEDIRDRQELFRASGRDASQTGQGNHPRVAAVLIEKAADLKSQVDEAIPPPDQNLRAPGVQPGK
jgi:lysozyme family protein